MSERTCPRSQKFELGRLNMTLREDANYIISEAIHKVLPDEAVAKALEEKKFGRGRLYLVSAGKAAWQMAKAAGEILGDRL